MRAYGDPTPRELQAFRLIAEGKRDADVAMILGCSAGTVRHHVWKVCMRIGAETRTHAAVMLVRSGKL